MFGLACLGVEGHDVYMTNRDLGMWVAIMLIVIGVLLVATAWT